MKTSVAGEFLSAPEGAEAAAALRRCVHCGFCNSVCPTYLQLGDENNGPRGRIYQMKNFMEGGGASAGNVANLDLCLTCQACESACPSGVDYLRLLDFARPKMAAAVRRPAHVRFRRRLALAVLLRPQWLKRILRIAAFFRPLLPAAWRAYLPESAAPPNIAAPAKSSKKVLLYDGCVQSALRPNINARARTALASVDIASEEARSFCCGALQLHLEDDKALARIRANVDFLHSQLQNGVSRIVSTASGCGRTVADYGRLLAHDSKYAERAREVSAAHCDLAELLAEEEELPGLSADGAAVAFHCPCTLQHGQKAAAAVPKVLSRLGAKVCLPSDGGRCCGSAGFYSQEHPGMARRLRDSRLRELDKTAATILTANIGCQLHLQGGSARPVKHWIEAVNIAPGRLSE